MGTIAMCFLLFPLFFLQPFGIGGDTESFQKIEAYGVVLLRFIAFYSLFDALTIIFSSAIKGAGDTKFVMKIIVIASLCLLVIPTYLAVEVFKWHLYVAWVFATAYIIVLGFIFLLRFMHGSWKKMLVIEQVAETQLLTTEQGFPAE
jgi:MATE family multidrug resistance protein